LAGIMAACGGDDSTGGGIGGGTGGSVGTGGSAGMAGARDGSAGSGGSAGTGGVRTDGSAGSGGTDASTGAGGMDGGPDARAETGVDDSSRPPDGDGALHLQLFTFDFSDAGPNNFGWNGSNASSNYVTVPVTGIPDDSDPTNPRPGAIQYTMRYGAFNDRAWIEVQFPPVDYSLYSRMHIWLKFGPPIDGVGLLQARIVNGDTGGYATVDVAANGDNNWHEVIVDMTAIAPGIKSTINKVGLYLPSAAAPPEAGSPDAGTGTGDAGTDAGAEAASVDAAPDAGPPDGGTEAASVDAAPDAGPPDGGTEAASVDAAPDAGPPDAGTDVAQTLPSPFTIAIDNIWLD
jgi:hypothetical protein